ncbi:helix-turn-helix domain-containing protein [Pseudomonas sp. FDAARGOS_380]|uniref:helix-turn-helix domain-containing protein n=1 Tax=Pseudomonas sp. FDAARGOS_380 TaxID=2018067 RepID=UPI0009B873A9|nr:helix-turn-helix domain-containing protein [Pseudomonas sp. FDAARGOS_380]ATN11751.1 helix-turn-helix domain-containing protein [Pseudomonas sp. FDAARGOS_380]
MSTIIMSLCWPLQGMSGPQKAVLISLADNANDEGVCWPSVARIAERTCLAERTVQGAIKWLGQASILSVRERMGRSTMYTLTPAAYAPPQEMHPAPDAPPPPQLTTKTPAAAAPRTVIEPSIESSPLVGGDQPAKVAKPKCPSQAIVDLFNKTLPALPQVAMLTKDRVTKIAARWNESSVHQDLDFWAEFFALVASSSFLMGEGEGRDGAKPFRATFDWLIKPSNFVKVVEGNYNA